MKYNKETTIELLQNISNDIFNKSIGKTQYEKNLADRKREAISAAVRSLQQIGPAWDPDYCTKCKNKTDACFHSKCIKDEI